MSDRFGIMTVKEVAEYLRLHESSIYRLSIQGKIPAYKVGRSWRFKKDMIDEWLHQSQVSIKEAACLDESCLVEERPFSDTLSDVH